MLVSVIVPIVVAFLTGGGLAAYFNAKAETGIAEIADDADIRNKLWEQQQSMWERIDQMEERHREEMKGLRQDYESLKASYEEMIHKYNTVILVLKALRAEYDYGSQIDEVLEDFGLKLNGNLVKFVDEEGNN